MPTGTQTFSKMNNKPDKAAAEEAVRVAALKVAKVARIAETDDRVAWAAKVRFKDAKKTWKLARKVAKRSAKRAKLAEKNLAALQKYLKRSGKQAKIRPVTKQKPAARKRGSESPRKRAAAPKSSAPTEPAADTKPGPGATGVV
jgi:hypothetical protein